MDRERGLRLVTERLPYSSRPNVAVGYAVAGAMVPAIVGWFLLTVARGQLLWIPWPPVAEVLDWTVPIAVLAVLLAIPVSASTWKHHATARSTPRRGAVLGGTAALCSLFASTLVSGAVAGPLLMGSSWQLESLGRSAIMALGGATVLTVGGLIQAGWLVVPAGACGGWLYQRQRREDVVEPARRRAVE